MLTAAHLTYRRPHSALGGATPYFKQHGKIPDLSGLRAIGARSFVHHERYRTKLEDRSFEGKLCGFGLDSKTYRIYIPSNGTVVESRNVTFIETPARTITTPSTDDDGYEHDVLSFTSLLENEAENSSGLPSSGMNFVTQHELIQNEVRHMRLDNAAREELIQEEPRDQPQKSEAPTTHLTSQRETHKTPTTRRATTLKRRFIRPHAA